MRVVAGKFKGIRFATPKSGARYTSDKVRGALFSMLRSRVVGCSFLDLFAGVGTVGIEAFSRGAAEVIFVEKNSGRVHMINRNLESCGIDPRSAPIQILHMDALRSLNAIQQMGKKFDIIFLDPPYRSPLLSRILKKMNEFDILDPDGMVIAEHDTKIALGDRIGELILTRTQRYGDTSLSFFQKNNSSTDIEV